MSRTVKKDVAVGDEVNVIPAFSQNQYGTYGEVVIDRVFTFDDIVEVHRYLEKNGQFGKIVVTV